MKLLSKFELNELVMMYSGGPGGVRDALIHATRILSEKNSEPKPQPQPKPKPKPHLPRNPRIEVGTDSEPLSDILKAFFWGT